jgi:lysine-specific permease
LKRNLIYIYLLAYVNSRGVPIYSLICTSAVSLVCFLTSWIPGSALFMVLSSLAGIAGLITWFGIALSHYRFRNAMIAQGKDLQQLPYIAPGHPYMNILVMVACIVIILISGWSYFVPADAIGLVGSYGGALIALGGYIILKIYTKSKIIPLDEIDLDTGVRYFTLEELES